jgi:hypothetical protein
MIIPGLRERPQAAEARVKEPALTIPVTQSATDHEEDAHGQRIAGPEPFEEQGATPEIPYDTRCGNGREGRVEQIHHIGDEDDAEYGPQHRRGRDGLWLGGRVERSGYGCHDGNSCDYWRRVENAAGDGAAAGAL